MSRGEHLTLIRSDLTLQDQEKLADLVQHNEWALLDLFTAAHLQSSTALNCQSVDQILGLQSRIGTGLNILSMLFASFKTYCSFWNAGSTRWELPQTLAVKTAPRSRHPYLPDALSALACKITCKWAHPSQQQVNALLIGPRKDLTGVDVFNSAKRKRQLLHSALAMIALACLGLHLMKCRRPWRACELSYSVLCFLPCW